MFAATYMLYRPGAMSILCEAPEAYMCCFSPPVSEYMKMFTEGTHFNPVDLVCATKDYQGNAFDLPKFVDPSTGFISSKSKNGKDLKALELPGLWNGAMSDWNTVFVEVPLGTFNPVKTVNDLLRDQHQAVEGGIKHEHHHEHGEGGCCGKH